MISDKNIVRILGKDVLVYPLIPANIEGASIFLTASDLAWSLKHKAISKIDDWIIIPSNDSIALITNESIALSSKYSGICFPRVPNTTYGLITCTTYIKPGWIGKLVIVIYNPTNKEQKIRINDPICVLSLDRLESSSSKKDIESKGVHFTIQMLTELGISMSSDVKNEISNHAFSEFKEMKYELRKSTTYKKFKEKDKKIWNEPINILISFIILCLIPQLISIFYCLINKSTLDSIITTLFGPTIGALFVLLGIKLK